MQLRLVDYSILEPRERVDGIKNSLGSMLVKPFKILKHVNKSDKWESCLVTEMMALLR